MKNLLTLMVILLLNTFSSFSQDKGYIALSLGPSIPLGDFASKDMDKESAGFAKAGAIFDISFGYKLGKHFGISGLLRGQANKTDAQAMANEIAGKIPFDMNVRVESETWSVGALMVGGYGSFPVDKKISIESRLMIGFLSANMPKVTFNLSTTDESAWVKRSSSTGSSFAYLIGAGIKYDAGKRVCVLANLDYLGANPQYNDVETTTSFGDYSKDNFSQTLGSFNIGFGVGYRL